MAHRNEALVPLLGSCSCSRARRNSAQGLGHTLGLKSLSCTVVAIPSHLLNVPRSRGEGRCCRLRALSSQRARKEGSTSAGRVTAKGRALAGVGSGQLSSAREKWPRFGENQQPALSLSLFEAEEGGSYVPLRGKLFLNRVVRASPGGNGSAFNPGEASRASTAASEVDRGNSQRQKSSCLSSKLQASSLPATENRRSKFPLSLSSLQSGVLRVSPPLPPSVSSP